MCNHPGCNPFLIHRLASDLSSLGFAGSKLTVLPRQRLFCMWFTFPLLRCYIECQALCPEFRLSTLKLLKTTLPYFHVLNLFSEAMVRKTRSEERDIEASF